FEGDGPVPTHRIRYEDLCANPEPILKETFQFLEEPWEEEVLKFYDTDHDKGNEDGRVSATRGFTVSQGNYRSWPDEVRTDAWSIVAPVAEALSYQDEA
ncbi:MAG: sulfotransferase domain-containing protein, partial [Akkermansiaceae bacterium]|nr:sulfotransferase domain-containing protein [Akkermansiaceae bacterium]